jgi:hypothetical protein
MWAHYYIKGDGGVGKEFVVFSEEENEDFSYGSFQLYKKAEVDLGDAESFFSYEAHYMKDT